MQDFVHQQFRNGPGNLEISLEVQRNGFKATLKTLIETLEPNPKPLSKPKNLLNHPKCTKHTIEHEASESPQKRSGEAEDDLAEAAHHEEVSFFLL